MFAQDSIKARSTFTHKAVDVVLADSAILARLAGAFVYLGLTSFSLKTQAAFAGVAPNIVNTRTTIQAWVYRENRERIDDE